VSQTLPF
jgi:periodic tryptophan protein 2